jgi:hypothetical protein
MNGQWHPDPTGRNQYRFWDGGQWTDHVSNQGIVGTDPLNLVPLPQSQPLISTQPTPGLRYGSPSSFPLDAEKPDRGLFDRVKRGKATFDAVRMSGTVEELRREFDELSALLVETRNAVLLQEVGLYEYRHPLEESDAYKAALEVARARMQEAVRSGSAVVQPQGWTVNGSTKEGEKMVKDLSKLVLRAYNNEADNLVRSMRPYALESSVARLSKARDSICRLVSAVKLSIHPQYHALRIYELELTADFLSKREAEREQAREERERLKEEEIARKEYESKQAELRRELEKRVGALQRLISSPNSTPEAIAELQVGILDVETALSGVTERLANIRAGHVYVISNFGSFGEQIVKIGMTRRLDPLDRVRELGDASVPFRFDVHALVFAEDALGLESKLHERFASRRVNLMNNRREFFYVPPAEVRAVLENYVGHVLVEFTEFAEALEWRQSVNSRLNQS